MYARSGGEIPAAHFLRIDPQGQLDGQSQFGILEPRLDSRLLNHRVWTAAFVQTNTPVRLSSVRVVRKPVVLSNRITLENFR